MQFLVSTDSSRSRTRCHLHVTISISYTCQLCSIICCVFLQCQVSCPGAGVSVLLCITVYTFSFCFIYSLVGVLATTAAFHVLALSPSLFLIFFSLAEDTCASFLFLFLHISIHICLYEVQGLFPTTRPDCFGTRCVSLVNKPKF